MESDNIKAVCQRLKLAEEEAMRKKAKNSKLFKKFRFCKWNINHSSSFL